jgi:pyruvate/2-oxoglutarate dehydrogenase complex dihydrolipoamide acyltransferase (E2) component
VARFAELEKVSSWRRIATAMWGESRSPQIMGFDDIDFTNLYEVLAELREESGENVTLTHFAVKCIGTVMAENPELNALVIRGKVRKRTTVDVFVQVAIKGTAGAGGADLSGIKVKDVDKKTIVEIATELQGRALKVRKGKDAEIEKTKRMLDLVPGFVLGRMMRVLDTAMFDLGINTTALGVKPDPFGCAMISNCESFGVQMGFAPLVPMSRTPMVLLLGRTDQKPVVHEGEIKIRPICRSSGTFDHRVLDGYQVGLIGTEFKRYMENPREITGYR